MGITDLIGGSGPMTVEKARQWLRWTSRAVLFGGIALTLGSGCVAALGLPSDRNRMLFQMGLGILYIVASRPLSLGRSWAVWLLVLSAGITGMRLLYAVFTGSPSAGNLPFFAVQAFVVWNAYRAMRVLEAADRPTPAPAASTSRRIR